MQPFTPESNLKIYYIFILSQSSTFSPTVQKVVPLSDWTGAESMNSSQSFNNNKPDCMKVTITFTNYNNDVWAIKIKTKMKTKALSII